MGARSSIQLLARTLTVVSARTGRLAGSAAGGRAASSHGRRRAACCGAGLLRGDARLLGRRRRLRGLRLARAGERSSRPAAAVAAERRRRPAAASGVPCGGCGGGGAARFTARRPDFGRQTAGRRARLLGRRCRRRHRRRSAGRRGRRLRLGRRRRVADARPEDDPAPAAPSRPPPTARAAGSARRHSRRADDQQDGQHGKPDRRPFLDDREISRQGDRTLDRNRTGQVIGRQHLLGVETDMRCVGAQEGRDVRGARQLVEAALLDRLEIGTTDSQALLDRRSGRGHALRADRAASDRLHGPARLRVPAHANRPDPA